MCSIFRKQYNILFVTKWQRPRLFDRFVISGVINYFIQWVKSFQQTFVYEFWHIAQNSLSWYWSTEVKLGRWNWWISDIRPPDEIRLAIELSSLQREWACHVIRLHIWKFLDPEAVVGPARLGENMWGGISLTLASCLLPNHILGN